MSEASKNPDPRDCLSRELKDGKKT